MSNRLSSRMSWARVRLASSAARRWVAVGMLCAVVQLGSPGRAYAIFGWLDHLSGPGPFQGIELQFQLFCVMNQPDREEAIKKTTGAIAALRAIPAPDPPSNFLPALDKQLEDFLKAIQGDQRDRSLQLLRLAAEIRTITDRLRSEKDLARFEKAIGALKNAEETAREAAVPTVRQVPASFLWANCHDHPNAGGETYRVPFRDRPWEFLTVQHSDRHPVFSLNLNYRYYTTGPYLFYGPSRSPEYAHGKTIQLQTIELHPSFPLKKLTWGLDIIDAQVGIGWYSFTSSDFPRFGGLIVEPARLDLHVPAGLLDNNPSPLLRLLYSISARVGLVMFPGGFSAGAFNATGDAAKDIPGSEVNYDWGVVVNVGRLFGK